MANVSSIKLPNNTTYNIVDKTSGYTKNTGTVTSVAVSAGTGISVSGSPITSNGTITISNSGVTGVKGGAESSYRTGQVNLTAANIGAISKSDELLTTNAFAPNSLKGPYISKIDNAFYAADKRWTITATNTSSDVSVLFDGSYETQFRVNDGKTSVITFDFSNSTYFPGYPYGYILISFYHVAKPASISGRVYCNYSSHGIGWHNISFTPIVDNTTSQITYRSEHQGYYQISQLEITIVGDTSNSYGYTGVTQIEMHLDRPDSSRNPFLSKYGAETLYYDLTAPNFRGNLIGNVTGNVSGSAGSVAWSGVSSKPTTISGYGITDAKIASGTITLGSNTITPLTSSSTLSAAKLSGAIPSTVTATTQASTDNSTKIATTAYVTTAIANLPEPMLFKGSVGTGGTVTSLPTAAAANEGWTYKVITALATPVTAKVGDTVISNGSEWVVIPSGDEPSGTVTSISAGTGLTTDQTNNAAITSSGTIKVKLNSETAITDTSKVYNVGVNSNGELCVKVSWSDIQTRTSDSGTERTIYLAGGTTSGDETDGLSKHESIKALVSSNTETDGYTILALGNRTSVNSAGAKYGCIRLYGKYNTFIDIRPQSLTNTGTIYLPFSGGTLVREEDLIPVAQQSSTLNVALVSSSSKSKFYDSHGGLTYSSSYFNDGSLGYSWLTLGNNIATGTESNARGHIRLYGNSTYYTDIDAPNSTATRTITLPDKTGTVALTSDIPTIPSNNVTGSGSTNLLAIWSGTNTLSSKHLSISTSYNSSSDLYGKVKLYVGDTGQIDWQGQLVFYDGSGSFSKTITITPPSLTAGRTLTLPDKTGTIALTSDIPTKVSDLTNDSGYLTGITSSQVITALGYTPYNSTNPNGYTSNTGTVTKVTAGTGLSIGTTAGGNFTTNGTINHTNSVTAQTTQAVYPIKIDAQGHISAYGSAVTIPTVNNATLTIQKNGTTVNTFTANASSDVTVNITVPTALSGLTNDTGFKKITASTSAPTANDGNDGDVWLVYTTA